MPFAFPRTFSCHCENPASKNFKSLNDLSLVCCFTPLYWYSWLFFFPVFGHGLSCYGRISPQFASSSLDPIPTTGCGSFAEIRCGYAAFFPPVIEFKFVMIRCTPVTCFATHIASGIEGLRSPSSSTSLKVAIEKKLSRNFPFQPRPIGHLWKQ
jgi:hypothetical protein